MNVPTTITSAAELLVFLEFNENLESHIPPSSKACLNLSQAIESNFHLAKFSHLT